MRLALALGRVDWRRMLREIEPHELTEWIAFYQLEPFGQEWHQTSATISGIVNEIRQISYGLGGQTMKEENAMAADHYVPGVAARKSVDEAKEATRALKGLMGL